MLEVYRHLLPIKIEKELRRTLLLAHTDLVT